MKFGVALARQSLPSGGGRSQVFVTGQEPVPALPLLSCAAPNQGYLVLIIQAVLICRTVYLSPGNPGLPRGPPLAPPRRGLRQPRPPPLRAGPGR